MKKATSILAFLFTLSYGGYANEPRLVVSSNGAVSNSSDYGPGIKATKNFLRYSSRVNALNVKLMPALYWSCIGIETEYPMSDAFSVSFNVLAKAGRTDGKRNTFKVRPESYQDPAYRLELALKYYLSNSAPVGFYGVFNISYGNLLFFDGTNNPYTLHSKWKSFAGGLRSPANLEPPKNFSMGVGAGYQLVIIPKKIIGNIMVATQLYIENDSGYYPALYVAPSMGYVF